MPDYRAASYRARTPTRAVNRPNQTAAQYIADRVRNRNRGNQQAPQAQESVPVLYDAATGQYYEPTSSSQTNYSSQSSSSLQPVASTNIPTNKATGAGVGFTPIGLVRSVMQGGGDKAVIGEFSQQNSRIETFASRRMRQRNQNIPAKQDYEGSVAGNFFKGVATKADQAKQAITAYQQFENKNKFAKYSPANSGTFNVIQSQLEAAGKKPKQYFGTMLLGGAALKAGGAATGAIEATATKTAAGRVLFGSSFGARAARGVGGLAAYGYGVRQAETAVQTSDFMSYGLSKQQFQSAKDSANFAYDQRSDVSWGRKFFSDLPFVRDDRKYNQELGLQLQARGLNQAQADKLSYDTTLSGSSIRNAGGLWGGVLIERSGERAGRSFLASSFEKKASKGTSTQNTFWSTFKLTGWQIGKAGAIEGGAAGAYMSTYSTGKPKASSIGYGAGVGVLSAGTLGGTIGSLRILNTRKSTTGSRILEGVSNVADPLEYAGDRYADFTERRIIQRGGRVRSGFTFTTGENVFTGTSTTTKSGTYTDFYGKAPSYYTPNFAVSPARTNTRSRTRGFSNIFGSVAPTPTRTNTLAPATSRSLVPSFTRSNVPSSVNVRTSVPSFVNTRTSVRTVVPSFAPTTVPTTVPVFTPPFPMPPMLGGDAFSFMGKGRGKRKYAYSNTLTGALFGKSGKKKRATGYTGLEIFR